MVISPAVGHYTPMTGHDQIMVTGPRRSAAVFLNGQVGPASVIDVRRVPRP